MRIDTQKWSGEGAFTQRVVDQLAQVAEIVVILVEDAPASRSEADYNFISNEIFVGFATVSRQEPIRRLGFLPGSRTVTEPAMTVPGLEAALTTIPDIGPPFGRRDAPVPEDRIVTVPPHQTRGTNWSSWSRSTISGDALMLTRARPHWLVPGSGRQRAYRPLACAPGCPS
jgi:hypothetical protein